MILSNDSSNLDWRDSIQVGIRDRSHDPIEIGLLSTQMEHYDESINSDKRRAILDMLEEIRK